MATLDWVILGVLAFSLLLGALRGLVYEVLSVLSWFAAFVLAQWLAPQVAPWLPMGGAAEPLRYAGAFAIVFVLAAGDFVVPEMAGGTAGLMIGNVIADQFKGSGANWPLGSALAILVICATVPITVVASRVTRFVTER